MCVYVYMYICVYTHMIRAVLEARVSVYIFVCMYFFFSYNVNPKTFCVFYHWAKA
jgi:hypothetical protein